MAAAVWASLSKFSGKLPVLNRLEIQYHTVDRGLTLLFADRFGTVGGSFAYLPAGTLTPTLCRFLALEQKPGHFLMPGLM